MSVRVRGLVMTAVAVLGIVVNVIDGADDGFSVWNGIGIACFLVVLAYGIRYLSVER
jgi:hypothetical protein